MPGDGFGISLTAVRLEAVDLPDELVRAQREGRLVLFVGAGASVAAPSSLPTFEGLAKRIGEESGRPYPGASSTSPDRFLGELKTLGVDVPVRPSRGLQRSTTSGKRAAARVRYHPTMGLRTAS